MRILSKKDLRALVLYSPAYIDRLEKAGLFPKRVHLGPCRVGWVESEVFAWIADRITERDRGDSPLEKNLEGPDGTSNRRD